MLLICESRRLVLKNMIYAFNIEFTKLYLNPYDIISFYPFYPISSTYQTILLTSEGISSSLEANTSKNNGKVYVGEVTCHV